jgi:hypothetical protein
MHVCWPQSAAYWLAAWPLGRSVFCQHLTLAIVSKWHVRHAMHQGTLLTVTTAHEQMQHVHLHFRCKIFNATLASQMGAAWCMPVLVASLAFRRLASHVQVSTPSTSLPWCLRLIDRLARLCMRLQLCVHDTQQFCRRHETGRAVVRTPAARRPFCCISNCKAGQWSVLHPAKAEQVHKRSSRSNHGSVRQCSRSGSH